MFTIVNTIQHEASNTGGIIICLQYICLWFNTYSFYSFYTSYYICFNRCFLWLPELSTKGQKKVEEIWRHQNEGTPYRYPWQNNVISQQDYLANGDCFFFRWACIMHGLGHCHHLRCLWPYAFWRNRLAMRAKPMTFMGWACSQRNKEIRSICNTCLVRLATDLGDKQWFQLPNWFVTDFIHTVAGKKASDIWLRSSRSE